MMKTTYPTAAVLLTASSIALAQSNVDTSLELKGRVMVDYAFFDGVHNEDFRGSEWELRRARLGIKHESKKGWEAELEINVDHDDETADIADGYVQYTGWDNATLTVGRMKEAFSLEDSTSSMDISTMERSMVTEAFAPGRSFGVEMADGNNSHSWNLGVFRASEDEHGLDSYALTGRLTLSPLNNDTQVVHMGISASIRDMEGDEYDIDEPAEINTARAVVESREIVADSINQFALESAWVYKRFSLQAEWMQQYVQEVTLPDQKENSIEFSGYYVSASLFLTGGSRDYDDGSFDESDRAPSGGTWELTSRFSSIDLLDMDEGSQAESIVVGLNYYATGRVKFMLNVARADVDHSDPDKSGSGNSVSFRAQYEF